MSSAQHKNKTVYRGTIPAKGSVRWGLIFVLTAAATLLDPNLLNGLLAFLGSALIVSVLTSGHGDKGSVRSPELRKISWKPHVLYWRQRPFWTIPQPFLSLTIGIIVWIGLALTFALNSQLAIAEDWRSIGFQVFVGLMLSAIAVMFVDFTTRYWFSGKWGMRIITFILVASGMVAFYVFWRQAIPEVSMLTQLGSLAMFIVISTWSVDSIHRGLRTLFGQAVSKS